MFDLCLTWNLYLCFTNFNLYGIGKSISSQQTA